MAATRPMVHSVRGWYRPALMKRIALAASVMAFLAGASSAQAESVALGYRQDTGPFPSVFFAPDTLERAESFQVFVTADPVQSLEYTHYISCIRGSESVSTQPPDQLITPPYSTTILPTLPEPDSCWITVSAETPFKGSKEGTIRVEVTGNRRPIPPPPPAAQPPPYWTQCSLPAWLKSGEAKVHGSIPCSRGKAIARSAWRKPAQAGNFVKASGYNCHRNELRDQATIRCTRDTNIVRIAGKLRRG